MTEEIYEIKKLASTNNVLLKEEEQDLIRRFQAGDRRAGDKLIRHNYRLVWNIATKFIGRGLDFKDLIQEGSMGLLKGINKFDLSRNLKLSTYATWWIRQGISRAIENKAKLIRIPINQLSKHTALKKKCREYIEENQAIPNFKELSDILGITEDQAKEIVRQMQEPDSLDRSVSDDENLTLLDYIQDDYSSHHVEEDVESSVDKEKLDRLLQTLEEDERVFIIYKFGLLDHRERTDSECSAAFQMSSDQVKQFTLKCLDKLRNTLDRDEISLDIGNTTALFRLLLSDVGEDPLAVMITLKNEGFSLLGLAYSEALVRLPCPLLEGVPFHWASDLLQKLRAAGADGSIQR